jgi:plastocyanin
MTRRLRALGGASILAVAALAALAAAPAVLAGDPCFHGYTIPATTTETARAVRMEPCAFVPTNVRLDPGATLTFTNTSGDVHLLTGANQAWGDREKEIKPGESVSITFDDPGVYAFSCALHRGMSGAVIVGDADGLSAAAPVSSAGSGSDTGLVVPVAIIGLAGLAALGWAAALLQRRRPATAEAPRVPVA